MSHQGQERSSTADGLNLGQLGMGAFRKTEEANSRIRTRGVSRSSLPHRTDRATHRLINETTRWLFLVCVVCVYVCVRACVRALAHVCAWDSDDDVDLCFTATFGQKVC